MYRIISASKDTYITNKIINNAFKAEDANVGQAGTLDLFKLYNESLINNSNIYNKFFVSIIFHFPLMFYLTILIRYIFLHF